MKLNDIKHNHSLTDILKILIFSILMMIPFIDVGIRCAYVVCNKNAYQSYYGETINEENKIFVENLSQFKTNTTYKLQVFDGLNETPQIGGESYRIYVQNVNGEGEYDYASVNRISFYINNTREITIAFRDSNNQILFDFNNVNPTLNTITLEYVSYNNLAIDFLNTMLARDFIYESEYNKYSYLDNVFDYSVNKLTTSELYTWTQHTAIYTGVQTMCTQLGINNTVIPLLLVYWFILTIIYIIIDIVLKLFTMLTHAIGSKTA